MWSKLASSGGSLDFYIGFYRENMYALMINAHKGQSDPVLKIISFSYMYMYL